MPIVVEESKEKTSVIEQNYERQMAVVLGESRTTEKNESLKVYK